MTLKEDTQPFVEQVAGYSKPGLDSFPTKQKPSLVASWMEARIKNSKVKNGTLNHCTVPQLQGIFALTDYSSLNTLNQDQLVMILQYLHQKEFHVGRFFEELMAKCTEDKIIPSLGFNARLIYHAGKTHYSENCHRALCAIYLGLIGDGMSQFTFVSARSNEANKCPWQIPGRDYISSCQLKNERDDDDEMEDVNRKFKRRRNNETHDGEE